MNSAFDCRYINTLTSTSSGEIGKLATGKLHRYLGVLGRALRELFGNRIDLCYFAMTATGIGFYKDAFVVALFKLLRVPLVIHLHSKGVSTRSGRLLDRLLYHAVFSEAAVIVLSRRLRADLQEYVEPRRLFCCPNGVPWERRGGSRARGRRPVGILFFSNMMEEKGVFVLLEACRILREELPFRCRFVGAWTGMTESSFVKRVEACGLSERVSYQGGAYGAEKAVCFEAADIFAFPTFYHNEAFPLVVIEAMKYSLPVVTTFEGGIPDLVEDGVSGMLCPQRDPVALAAALRRLITDEESRVGMGQAGRKRFEENFTLSHFEGRLTGILAELASRRADGPWQAPQGNSSPVPREEERFETSIAPTTRVMRTFEPEK